MEFWLKMFQRSYLLIDFFFFQIEADEILKKSHCADFGWRKIQVIVKNILSLQKICYWILLTRVLMVIFTIGRDQAQFIGNLFSGKGSCNNRSHPLQYYFRFVVLYFTRVRKKDNVMKSRFFEASTFRCVSIDSRGHIQTEGCEEIPGAAYERDTCHV